MEMLLWFIQLIQIRSNNICAAYEHTKLWIEKETGDDNPVLFTERGRVFHLTDHRLTSLEAAKKLNPITVDYDNYSSKYLLLECPGGTFDPSVSECKTGYYSIKVVAASEIQNRGFYILNINYVSRNKSCQTTGVDLRNSAFLVINSSSNTVEAFNLYSVY